MGLSLEMTYLHFFFIYSYPIGSMYAIYGNIYHQYTPNVSIYTSTMDPIAMWLWNISKWWAHVESWHTKRVRRNPPRTLDLGLDERRCYLKFRWFEMSIFYLQEWFPHPLIRVCLKIDPIVPNGFADHYPYEKWLFHWEYTQHFQTNP